MEDQHDLIGLLGLRVDEVMYAEVMGCGVWATANCISAISVFIGGAFLKRKHELLMQWHSK